MDGSPYGWPRRRAVFGGTVVGSGFIPSEAMASAVHDQLLPPIAVLTRPQDWSEPARSILWPELERRQGRG